uniref:Transcription factor A, mitochondrial n=1 Tax=Astyanax mexicanus TaxID=7994 RepID=A0A3B1KFZ3_ASTMX
MAPFGLISVGNALVRSLGLFSSAATLRCSSIAPALKLFCTSAESRPKSPISAYSYYMKAQFGVFKRQYPGTTQVDIVKKIAQQWNILTPEQKRPFEELSSASKEQYKVNLKNYMEQLTPAQAKALEEKKRQKTAKRNSIRKKREQNSLGKPKGCRTAFNIFMAEHFEEAKGNTLPDKMRNLQETWKSFDASQKQVYVQLAEDDKVRYKNEIKVWEEHMSELGKEHLIRKKVQKKTAVKKDSKKKAKVKKSTAKGRTAKGSTAKGSTAKGSTAKGSTAKGSTEKGSTVKESTAKESTVKGKAGRPAAKRA